MRKKCFISIRLLFCILVPIIRRHNIQIFKVERALLSNSYSRIHLLFSLLGPRNNGLNRETKVTGFKKGEGFIWQMAVVKGLFCTSILWWVPGDHKSSRIMHHIYSCGRSGRSRSGCNIGILLYFYILVGPRRP